MYQNLINSLKKILDSKATQAEKLLKISTLVDFADGLDRPNFQSRPMVAPDPYRVEREKPAPKPNGPGAIIGVEDIK